MILSFEPPHEKTNNLHMPKLRRRSAVTAKLISAFVFATRIVQFLYFLNPKFPASSHLLCLYSPFVSDLFGNHIVGFPTRGLISVELKTKVEKLSPRYRQCM